MKPATWRAMTLSFIGFTSALAVLSSLHRAPSGDFGFDGQPNAATHQILVTSVADNSPAGRAGIRRGDFVLPKETTFGERISSRVAHPGDVIAFEVRRGSSVRSVRLTARSGDDLSALFGYLVGVMKFLFLGMAALIAARRPDDPAARALTAFFAMFGFAVSIDYGWFRSPAIILTLFILIEAAFVVGGRAPYALPRYSHEDLPRVFARSFCARYLTSRPWE